MSVLIVEASTTVAAFEFLDEAETEEEDEDEVEVFE